MSADTVETAGVRRKVEEFVSAAKDQADRLKKNSIEDIWTGALDYAKDNPGKTILVSLGLGVLIGSLIRRK